MSRLIPAMRTVFVSNMVHRIAPIIKSIKVLVWTCCIGAVVHGCSLNDLVSKSAPPADLLDPKVVQNAAGAMARYRYALTSLATTMASGGSGQITTVNNFPYVMLTGLLTDELAVGFQIGSSVPVGFPSDAMHFVDSRSLSNIGTGVAAVAITPIISQFSGLQGVRISAREARNALQRFSTETPRAVTAHLYAIEAFANILLAESFCSGIPLPIVHFERGYTLTRGFSSDEIYRQSLSLLDSALPLAMDSVRILHFIDLMRARAYNGLALYDSAAAAVVAVPDAYRYDLNYSASEKNYFLVASTRNGWPVSVANREGRNGLDFVSSQDPRTAAVQVTSLSQDIIWFPQKYAQTGLSPVSIASGIQARLIRAEAELNRRDNQAWLATLNELRTTGGFTVTPNAIDPTVSDTTWAPGTGATHFPQPFPGLRPLDDPGSDTARVSLLFRERAFWLFLTGQRQGDLRRLVRQYHRPEDRVYPSGYWGPLQAISYGTEVVFPTPVAEQELNPFYRGCLSNDA